jgi:uncharacterized protein YecE (DUF72 family)
MPWTGKSAARIRIGISGWRYAPWRGALYPPELPHRLELTYAASIFSTIEINGSFYSLQLPESWRRWYAETRQDFQFAVKGPRFVTHMLKLRGVDQPLANFLASGACTAGASSRSTVGVRSGTRWRSGTRASSMHASSTCSARATSLS